MSSTTFCCSPLDVFSFFFFLNNVCDPSSGTSENILLQIGLVYEVGKIPGGTGGEAG